MAVAMPKQGKLVLPIEWSGEVKKITQEVGSYSVETTLGINPTVEKATFTWMLPPGEIKDHINVFKNSGWVGQYTYTCPIMGNVTLRPTANFSFTEDVNDQGIWAISIDFRRIS